MNISTANKKSEPEPSEPESIVRFRQPDSVDGYALNQLIERCKPLDTNSVYCNLLQCTHFSATGCAAEMDGQLVGFVSAYRLPQDQQTLFVWQVAVAETARGQGLAARMIESILERVECKDIRYIEATITPDNGASWGLFESLARKFNTSLRRAPMFDRERHFAGQHDSEESVRVGPID